MPNNTINTIRISTTDYSISGGTGWYLHKLRFDIYYYNDDEEYFTGLIFDYLNQSPTAFTTAQSIFNDMNTGGSLNKMKLFNNHASTNLDTDVYSFTGGFASMSVSSDYYVAHDFSTSDCITLFTIGSNNNIISMKAYLKKQSTQQYYAKFISDDVIPL